jgi:hypothetical protein
MDFTPQGLISVGRSAAETYPTGHRRRYVLQTSYPQTNEGSSGQSAIANSTEAKMKAAVPSIAR